jgi:hypothetical protein
MFCEDKDGWMKGWMNMKNLFFSCNIFAGE